MGTENELYFLYTLKNNGRNPLKTIFGVEFNLTMPYANSDRYRYSSGDSDLGDLGGSGETQETDSFSIKDSTKELEMMFKFSLRPERVIYFPVKTVSRSETGFELNYQNSCIFLELIYRAG